MLGILDIFYLAGVVNQCEFKPNVGERVGQPIELLVFLLVPKGPVTLYAILIECKKESSPFASFRFSPNTSAGPLDNSLGYS